MDSKNNLLIEPAKNGFLVYVNYYFSQTSCKPTPYVFETMESLLNFVQNEMSTKTTKDEIIQDESEERLKY